MKDILSDIITDMRARSVVFCQADLSEPWGFEKPSLDGAPFHLVVRGRASVRVEGKCYELEAGDYIVLPRGNAHLLVSQMDSETVPFADVLSSFGTPAWHPGMKLDGPVKFSFGGGGRSTTLISGIFTFSDQRPSPLRSALPVAIVVRPQHEVDANLLVWTIHYMTTEVANFKPGASSIISSLADTLFVQSVRTFVTRLDGTEQGWLSGLRDPVVGSALSSLHKRPEQPWTLALLAKSSGMSRSSFAARFRAIVGHGPMGYLAQLRMHIAGGLLLDSKLSRGEIASRIGYRSEAAFSIAFKRWSGLSPRHYSRTFKRGDSTAVLL